MDAWRDGVTVQVEIAMATATRATIQSAVPATVCGVAGAVAPTQTERSASRTVDEQFLQLVCSDPVLLAAEFDAIIAAGWTAGRTDEEPSPPVRPPWYGTVDGRPGNGAPCHIVGLEAGVVPGLHRPHCPGVGGWARERSPPRRPF